MTDREIMQQALEALEMYELETDSDIQRKAIAVLRERLAQPAQELVIDCPRCGHCCPQRKPLTDKAITKVIDSMPSGINGWMSDWDLYDFTRAIEAAHGIKEKNT